MKTISKRLQRLETLFAPRAEKEDDWGGMAGVRDEMLRVAALQGETNAAETKRHLDALGPHGLWLEPVRGYLKDHGFVQSGGESFAETIARALRISSHELAAWIAQGRIGSALLERFSGPGVATDNTNYRVSFSPRLACRHSVF
jgi:hypothetical protein